MADQNIRIQIEAILKERGLLDTKRRLEEVAGAATKTGGAMGFLSAGAMRLGAALAGLITVGQAVRFTLQQVVDWAKFERALSSARLKMESLGMSAEQYLPFVRQYLEQLERAGGPLATETIPVFNRFIGVTKDVNAALAATKLAADISEEGTHDLGTAAAAVANILQGRAAMAAQTLGIELRKMNGEVKSNAELLGEVIKLYGDFSSRTNDAQDQLDKLVNSWMRLKREWGEAASGLLNLNDILEANAKLLAIVNAAAAGDINELLQNIRTGFGPTQASKEIAEGQTKLVAQALRASAPELAEEARKSYENALKALFETGSVYRLDEKARREAGRTTARDFDDFVPFEPGAISEAWTDEFDVITEATRQLYAQQLNDAELAISEQFEKRQQIIDLEYQKERELAGKNATLLKIIDDKYTEASKQNAQERLRAEEEVARAKIMMNLQVAQQALAVLAAMFPKIKAIAIAQAMLSAYEAYLKIIAQGGLPGIAVASAVLTGLMKVIQTMKSIEPGNLSISGSGGGGRGGRIIAGDAAAGAAAQRPPGQQSSMVVNIHGTVIDSQQATRKLHRALKVEERRDRARFAR